MQASHSLRELWPYHRGPHVYAGVIMGSDNDGTQCNGDYVTHPSSTVCLVNPSIQDPSVRVDGLNPE